MIEALRRLDRKFLIFIGCLILIPVLLIVFLIMAQGCSNKKIDYSKYEFQMKTAAKKYLNKVDNMPSEKGDYVIVELDTLVENSYIKSPEKAMNDKTCTGYVGVRKESKVNYTAVLSCDSYKTKTLAETLKRDLTTDSEGLYATSDGYVFKGLNVNNYLELGGQEYRIIGITNKNAVKLYKVESETTQIYWDSKYNVNTKDSTGINIYKDSYILEFLNKQFSSSSKIQKIKNHIIASDVCVYSKGVNDRFLDKSKCKESLTEQYLTLISLDDFMNASLDPNCVDLYSKSCRNYNYLGRIAVYTWTKDVVSDNDYQVYYLSNGMPCIEEAKSYETFNIVMYVDGDVIVSGKGTKDNPYTLK